MTAQLMEELQSAYDDIAYYDEAMAREKEEQPQTVVVQNTVQVTSSPT